MAHAVVKRSAGFTLIELVSIIVLVSIAAVGFTAAYAPLVRSPQLTQDLDFASQLAARCAEHILGQRRVNTSVGFAGVVTDMCGATFDAGGYTVTDTASALSGGACPAGRTCKSVVVTASNGASSRAVNLLLVQ